MHFGYYKCWENPIDLEKMHQQMNKEVLDALELGLYNRTRILDMGCGLGTTLLYAAKHYPIESLDGIDIDPHFIKQANTFIKSANLEQKIYLKLADYRVTSFADNTFDGVYALESSCYIDSVDKNELISEMYRVLKPKRRIVIADGFIKGFQNLNQISKYAYKHVCRYWSLGNFGEIEQVQREMKATGLSDIKIRDISWNVAPSILFSPFVSSLQIVTKKVSSEETKESSRHSLNNLLGPLFLLILGATKSRFGYYLISAKKF